MTDQQKMTCESCRHWHRMTLTGGVVQLDVVRGQCRAAPPSVSVYVNQQGQVVGQACAYPQVPPTHDRCGMHEPGE